MSAVETAKKEPSSIALPGLGRALILAGKLGQKSAEDIYRKGIYLAGGGSLLAGLAERLSLETGLPFIRTTDPLTAIVRGSGKVVENFKQFKHVCIA